MKVIKQSFGVMPDGKTAYLYTLDNGKIKVIISDLGGDIISIFVPDKNGKAEDIVLGYNDFDAYLTNPNFFGAVVGRNANRIANARIEISGKVYELEKNNGEANLHSGKGNMTFRLFNAETSEGDDSSSLILSLVQKDMSDGLPGNLDVKIIYTLDDENSLTIEYRAVSDKDTVINLTNHSYFNLAGHASGNIYSQILKLNSDFYTPNNAGGYPTGEILSVTGTPFDFRNGRAFGQDINSDDEQIKMCGGGYDHNFVLAGKGYRKVAEVTDNEGGRVMETWTDQPGVQLFTANGNMNNIVAKAGAAYARHQAFCLETQVFPNAAEMPWTVSPLYKAGQEYYTKTSYRFRTLP